MEAVKISSAAARAGFWRNLGQILAAAPAMVLSVYGVPVVLLVAGVACALLVLINALLHRIGATYDIVATTDLLAKWSIAFSVASLPAYWLLAAAYGLGVYVIGVRPAAPVFSPPSLAEQRVPTAEVLVIEVPADKPHKPPRGRGLRSPGPVRPPLTPWLTDSKKWDGRFRFERIGLVLAGGGAKGVYQAGAMKAIHEFLQARGALGSVVSIAGTSIGSWNALFWLSGLVDPDTGQDGKSAHELWWTRVKLRQLVRPAARVIPALNPYLMRSTPWQAQFTALFEQPHTLAHDRLTALLREDAPIHFYLTRTNVLQGRLAFDTNNAEVAPPREGLTHDLDRARLTTSLRQLREAVFASMDLPPLFPYSRVASPVDVTWCEDGGVIDNLPIRLATAFDRCDLLFILPLNASFYEAEAPKLLFTRLSRVMNVRQGVLERAALKNVYLFNLRWVLSGERNPIPAFVIAPGQPLLVGTTEFWKSGAERARALQQMYDATRQALEDFFDPQRLWDFYSAFETMKRNQKRTGRVSLLKEGYVRMAVVDPGWESGNQFDYDDRF